MDNYIECTLEIVEVEGKMVHYILSAHDKDGHWRHVAGIIEAGDDLPISEMLEAKHEQRQPE